MGGDWRHQSVGQRRRMGAPSSVHDPAGHSAAVPMARDEMAEAVAGMAAVGNPRQPMDRSELASMVNRSATGATGGKMVPRATNAAMDPALFPVAVPRAVLQEKAGARYGLKVDVPAPISPEAGPTQANGRLIRGRGVVQNFYGV